MLSLTLIDGADHLTLCANGRLTELVCNGVALDGLDRASLWRLFYVRGQRTQVEIRGDGQRATLEQRDDGLRLRYDGLLGPDGPLDVELVITLRLEAGAAIFAAQLVNRDPQALIKELQLPLIGDEGLLNREVITSSRGGQRHSSFVRHVRQGSRFGGMPYADADHEGIQAQVIYPSLNAACNCVVSAGKEHGLYLGCHDAAFPSTVHISRLDGERHERPEIGFGRHMMLRQGEAERLGSFVVAPYRGSWHVAADRYRAWVDTWWQRRPVPAWVRRSLGWQRLIFKHQNGEVLFRYDDLPDIHADGAAAGLDSLLLFGWWPWGFDRMYPEYEPDPELGGAESLQANIRIFQQELGGNVILYSSGRLADRASPWYRRHGAAESIKRPSGLEVGDAYLFSNACTYDRLHGSTELTPICQSSKLWNELLHGLVDQAADLGCRAIFFDQVGNLEKPCHDPGHDHPVPYFHQATDKRMLLDSLQSHARTRDSEMAVGIEIITDCTAQYADFIHGVYQQHDIPAEDYQALGRRPETVGFIEFFRYCFPDVAVSDRDIRDDVDLLRRINLVVLRGMISDAEIYRCRRTIAAYPEYQHHLGQLNALRRRLAPWLVEGIYRDTCGFTLSGDVEARLFLAADGSVAVVATQSHLENCEAEIHVPDRACTRIDGVGDYDADQQTGRLRLARHALVVLVFN